MQHMFSVWAHVHGYIALLPLLQHCQACKATIAGCTASRTGLVQQACLDQVSRHIKIQAHKMPTL